MQLAIDELNFNLKDREAIAIDELSFNLKDRDVDIDDLNFNL
jgi:hypothetical protein